MSDCDLIQVHLACRASGELPGETEALVARHLRRCAPCRDEAARLEATARMLAASVGEAVSPGEDRIDWDGFRAATMARIGHRSGSAPPWWRRSSVLLAAAAGLALAVALPLALRTGPGGGGEPELAVAEDGVGVRGPEAGRFLEDLELTRTRQQTARLLRSGRNLLMQLAAAPVYCDRDRPSLALERDQSLLLLRQKEVLEPALHRPSLGRTRAVCDDLARVLRGVALLGDCPERAELDTVLAVAVSYELLPRIDAALQAVGEEGGRLV